MPTFKKNPNPLMKRSGFKMRSGNSPLKQDNDARSMKRNQLSTDINAFFSGLGKSVSDATSKIGAQLKKGQKERGIFSEYGKAEKRSRKPGESKYQADVRRRRESMKTAKPAKPAKIVGDLEKEIIDTSDLTVENRAELGESVYPQPKQKESKGVHQTFSGKPGDKYKYRISGGIYGKANVYEFQRPGSDIWETSKTKKGTKAIKDLYFSDYEGQNLETIPIQKKSPTKKRSGFKMKNSPAKNYKKGYYGA